MRIFCHIKDALFAHKNIRYCGISFPRNFITEVKRHGGSNQISRKGHGHTLILSSLRKNQFVCGKIAF